MESSPTPMACSHWWHAPFYLATSLLLAFIAITSLKHSGPGNPPPSGYGLAFNASRALRHRGGFHIFATLLQISPDLFFPGNQSTVFAIQDSGFSNLSIPPWETRQLLRYHTTPSTHSMLDLLKKPPGFCLKTLVENKNLVVTKNDAQKYLLMINNVLISQPDIFLQGPIAIHGVLASFASIPSPPCRPSHQNATVEWTRIVRLLSSNGYVSFAIGLNAVLDGGVLEHYQNLSSVTIFAPPNSDFISSSSPFLNRIMRLHILPQRFTFMELAASLNSSLTTLVPTSHLQIHKVSQSLAISGVEITRPDMFSSKNYVVHGISRDFDLHKFFTSFK